MTSVSDQELLREYGVNRSEAAFAELVGRHVDLVYGTALRMVRDRQLAEEVAQGTFLALAREAKKVSELPVVVGWLYRTTQNLAANCVRSEVRRRARETEAAAMKAITKDEGEDVSAHLDAAMGHLSEADRELVLLRYFKGKSAREMGEALGIKEDAAQRRLSRAVERLREFFFKQGVAISTGALVSGMSASAVQGAPAALASLISGAVTREIIQHSITVGAAKGICMTTTQKAVVALSLAAVVGTGVYEVQQTAERNHEHGQIAAREEGLRKEMEALRSQRETEANRVAELEDEIERLKGDAAEVHRLRGEVTQLRAQAVSEKAKRRASVEGENVTEVALTSWLNRTEWLKQLPQELPEKAIPELALLTEEDWLELAKESLNHSGGEKLQTEDPETRRRMFKAARTEAKMKFGFLMSRALDGYREAHEDRLPSDPIELFPYFSDREPHLGGSAEHVAESMLRRYEILQRGTFEAVPAEKAIILGEIAPVDEAYDTRLVIGKHWLQTAGDGDAAYWTR